MLSRRLQPRALRRTVQGLRPLRDNGHRFVPTIPQPSAQAHHRQFQSLISKQKPWREIFADTWKSHPLHVMVASGCILLCIGFFGYTLYVYDKYILKQFSAFPEPVAVKMRRAIYYSNYELDHAKAIKYFRQALEVAQECNMHPLSPEVLGIKVELAHFLERTDHHEKAINVLELVRADCLKWIEERGGLEENAAARTRILQTAIRLAAKLGGLYADKNVMERELAEERVAWAVETSLKEKERRNTEGVKPDEGEWMDDEEFGAIFETLGHLYEERNIHYLAAPCFLQALAHAPKSKCHSVILMNNLATSLAQQIPPPTPNMPPPSRTALIASARAWAQKARDVSAAVSGPERTEECDVGCAVATHNLGEFAEMEERVADARHFYSEAAGLAKSLGFEEGVGRAREGLRRLENRGRTIDADRASRQSTSSV